ncbi:HaeIII family restriction endonuclease [Streptococcus agalactiae]|uniref:HaeIII family restriction endonuclease n=1 Tax=Streptococcus agalactiae TaxID=1311 RepID=UPI0002E1621B|nr:HaeIII family restriction endonuclease [Streptococcus agalactiae]
MSKGKAFEYATAMSFYNYIIHNSGMAQLRIDGNFRNVENSFNALSSVEQNELMTAANTGCMTVVDLEPALQDIDRPITISIAPDHFGQMGDVRDVILAKEDWEIGISCKHNHQALKHQRLSNNIDFGNEWAGYPVSQNYWQEVLPIFQMLQECRRRGINWRDLANHGISKEYDVYVPLLSSFLTELNALDYQFNDLAPKFVEYLVGRKDFYKFVMNENREEITVYCYNLHGDLGRGSNVPVVELPTCFISKGWKINRDGSQSNNTLIIEMDNDWTVGLRLHSADSLVESSLKFDSQPINLPSTLLIIHNSY